jgi:cell wall-associated NlpC family hydrolase
MEYAVISVPAAPVRRKPGHREEMVNQLLFGETVRVIRFKNPLWAKIQSLHDLYEGWVLSGMLTAIDENIAHQRSAFVTGELFSSGTLNGNPVHLPIASSLPFLVNGNGKLGTSVYQFHNPTIQIEGLAATAERACELAQQWINVPYLWGGRTPLGVDCSGFMQVIFKLMGTDISRDASQQALEGKGVKKFRNALAGDLAFFSDKGAVTHVGLVLPENRIIHASGKVRVDILDKKGIIDAETGRRRKQRLECIRRYCS